jgi:molybdate transport system ATP-binding protein
LLAGFGIPIVLVTHDRLEAMSLADQVVVLDQGRVLQAAPVDEVFSRPVDAAVAQIVGVESVNSGRIVSVAEGLATVRVGQATLLAVAASAIAGDVLVCIRAETVVLERERSESSGRNQLKCRVQRIASDGPLVRIELEAGFPLTALVTRTSAEALGLQEGSLVTAVIKASAIHLIPK